jgi:hypothetical protein
MYKLSFVIENSSQLLLSLYVILCLICSFFLFIYCKSLPNWLSQKNIIVQQDEYIESLNSKIHYLYNSLFELESLLEDIIDEINDEHQMRHTLEHKNRIVREIKY